MKVFLIVATTADGMIGRSTGHLADWTSPEDKKLFVRLTKEAGVMVMGARTFETIGRALPGRRTIVYTSKPESITVEGVEATNESPTELVARLKNEGASGVAICGGASIYQLFMESGLVDEVYLTLEPLLFGTGVPLFSGQLEVALQLVSLKKLNENTVLLHYKVKKHD
ncbi:bifunctional deaminase-reductase domain protein [candidate division TM7 genomosp. GTL1]|nr:bifunctional deaminase-reductase domain protein [candidate division TM7 genomosp. GTL1]